MEAEIKVAQPDDAESLLNLMKKLVRESDTFSVDPEIAQLSVKQEARQLIMINQTRGNIIIVAEYQHDLIGVVTVQRLSDSDDGELGVAVRKPFWNFGLGKALVREAIRWGRIQSNLHSLLLIVEKRNHAAVHIYRECGFKDHMKHRIIQSEGNYQSTIEMKIKVK
ncbi:hypothetical protein WR164_10970 [Philodulcilactobacillus myokoensis]|uniref:N-acetyltransferase domain-containing protein n=1 Tax=Philodulcilactobacillus myokoensis TaxID=2929573 RepID=A0A9W6B1V4_9LACO|nr:GNAT family N-acetyltransferase [Philodulcilactobacillus myokoensis]GLB47118.1 hypothetical protein WR164_10970 [Philodulcilactobacillus myokoensis]